MLKVGLTGGMACGKTAVGEMFARRGAFVTQADKIAHDIMLPGEAVYNQVVARFGRDILAPDGSIDRAKLADAVFARVSSSTREAPSAATVYATHLRTRIYELNEIVHPAVIRRQEEWMEAVGQRDPGAVAIVEAALIFEAGVGDHFDKIVVVICDPDQKVERFARRANLDRETATAELERRSATQLPDIEKARRAHFIIYNSGSLEDTDQQVERVFAELKREALRHASRS